MHHTFSATKNVKTRFSHAELYKIIVEDNRVCLSKYRHWLSYIFNIWSQIAQLSVHFLNPIRTTMHQGRLDALSLLCIEADVLFKINFGDMIKDFAIKKVGESF